MSWLGDDKYGGGNNMRLRQESLPAGTYYIRVSGPLGNESGPYSLTVKTLPASMARITSIQPIAQNASPRIGFEKQLGWYYYLQRSGDGKNWTTWFTFYPDEGGVRFVDDSGMLNTADQMLYRIAITEDGFFGFSSGEIGETGVIGSLCRAASVDRGAASMEGAPPMEGRCAIRASRRHVSPPGRGRGWVSGHRTTVLGSVPRGALFYR
ncbi:MAG: hypothetical protein R3F11_16585 [Verrucomicrobiales bacterium]